MKYPLLSLRFIQMWYHKYTWEINIIDWTITIFNKIDLFNNDLKEVWKNRDELITKVHELTYIHLFIFELISLNASMLVSI